MSIPRIASYSLTNETLPENRVQWRFEPAHAALLVHDMQEYFLDFYDRTLAPVPQMVANLRQLIAMSHASGMPVFYTMQPTQQTPRERALLNDMWGPGITAKPSRADICAELAPKPQDIVLAKWRYSAFQRSDLQQRLLELARTQLVIGGIYAHIGCLMTACEAFMRDICPFFVADALADFSAQEHRMALDYVAHRCGRVVVTKDLLQAAAMPIHTTATTHTLPTSLAELKVLVAAELQIAPDELRNDDSLLDWGLDSVRTMSFVERWRSHLPQLQFVQLAQAPTLTAWWNLLRTRNVVNDSAAAA